ncbi:hypothetical protein [Microbacterium sp. HJ5]
MSQGYGAGGVDPYVDTSGEKSNMAETAKHEAGEVKDAAAGAAKDVASTAKSEAAGVARETKFQVRELYDQGKQELRDQASKQQQRLATGLTSVGGDLRSMAANSNGSGIAGDLVQRASDRVEAAGTWFADRDPATVFSEVKAFARRRPGVFIAAGVVAGVVVGRLTRALAANASDASQANDATTPALPTGYSGGTVVPPPVVTTEPVTEAESPIYSQSAARLDGGGMEMTDERSDSL